MATELTFILAKAASKGGGDRYENFDLDLGVHYKTGKKLPFVIYFPQQMSRKNGVPASEILVRMDLVE